MSERCGPDFPATLRQPFALTLYAYQQLQERDRIQRLRDRADDVHRGFLLAMAVNKPSLLDLEQDSAQNAMRLPPPRANTSGRLQELERRGRELAERIIAQRVLEN